MTELEKVIQLNMILNDYIRIHDFLADMEGSDKRLILRIHEDVGSLGIVDSPATLELDNVHRLFEAIQTVITQELYKKREEMSEVAKYFRSDQDKDVIDKTKPY